MACGKADCKFDTATPRELRALLSGVTQSLPLGWLGRQLLSEPRQHRELFTTGEALSASSRISSQPAILFGLALPSCVCFQRRGE